MKLGIIASSGMILPETKLWVKACSDISLANGGLASALSGDQIFHTNRFVEKMKAASLWSDIIAYYPMCGSGTFDITSKQAHRVNLKNPGTYDLNYVVNGTNNYHAGIWSMRSTSDVATTGIVPSAVFDINNLSWGYYSNGGTSGGTPFGVRETGGTASTKAFTLYANTAANPLHSVANAWSTAGGFVDAPRQGTNVLSAVYSTRDSSTSLKLFHRGILKATSSTANPGSLPTLPIYLGGINDNGTSIINTTVMNVCSVWFATRAFTDAEMLTFYTIEQEYMTSLGRNA